MFVILLVQNNLVHTVSQCLQQQAYLLYKTRKVTEIIFSVHLSLRVIITVGSAQAADSIDR